jgi:L-seryl-tRNA(Ser) seleniumtransferase
MLSELRHRIGQGEVCPSRDEIADTICRRAEGLVRSLRPVINATGVILHTNLGRAPLSQEAIAAMEAASRGYVDLEVDLATGKRGSRHVHVEAMLCQLSGAEAAIVVNNNASAVLLGLAALAKGREVIVSRGQAVQIGGGFRIPDVMRQSGARLVEVGTTNFTYLDDYEQAITPRTAALLMVHSSNFKVVGFTESVPLHSLADLGRRYSIPVLDDVGSGCFLDTSRYGLDHEPMVQESMAAGSGLTFFSGDKLLGGPQAGVIGGQAALMDRLRRHPLLRAVRIDKTRMAGLAATLLHYLRGEAETKVPVWRMIAAPLEGIESRARRWAAALGGIAEVEDGVSMVGGGSLPGSVLPTRLVVIRETARGRQRKLLPEMARLLRAGNPPVLCRIEKDRLLLDPRTVMADEERALLTRLRDGIARVLSGS